MGGISSSEILGASESLLSGSTGASGGALTELYNQPIMSRDSHLASNYWGFNGSSFTTTPKHKFLYYVKFVRGSSSSSASTSSSIISGLSNLVSGNATSTDWSSGCGFLAKRVSRPNVEFDTEVLNQYNKKRIIQTSHKIGSMSVEFHDTVDNQIMNMFQEYYQYYYADPQNTSTTAWINDITSGTFQTGVNDWGFSLNSNTATNTYFFDRIELYQVFAGQYSQINFANPKITRFIPDELSFEAGGETCSIEMELEFEGMVFIANNQSIANNSSLVSDLKLTSASYYQPTQDTNLGLSLTYINDIVLSNQTTTNEQTEFGASYSPYSTASSTATDQATTDTFTQQLASVTGLTGAYASEDAYTKLFNTVNQARLDTMISQNYGDLAANLGFDFFNTGTASSVYFQASNPTLRNTSLLGDFL